MTPPLTQGGQGRDAPDINAMCGRDLLRMLIGVALACAVLWGLVILGMLDHGTKTPPEKVSEGAHQERAVNPHKTEATR